MKIYPAIDIRNGQAVRLYKGDYDRMTVYAENPIEVAHSFAVCGAKYLHLVDLDGALSGTQNNRAIIEEIAACGDMFVEIGGGVRNMSAIENYILAGVDRVIIGSIAAENPEFVKRAIDCYGDKIAVGVDAKEGYVAIHGWKTITDIAAFDFCEQLSFAGVRTVIYTDISRDGTLEGPNFSAYERLVQMDKLNIIASGGISSLDDLKKLSQIGVDGAILGKAIYAGKIGLSDALSFEK